MTHRQTWFCYLIIKRAFACFIVLIHKKISDSKRNIVFFRHLSHVLDSISDSAKSCVDTYAQSFGNILEAHLVVESHYYYLPLAIRQEPDHSANVTMYLALAQHFLFRWAILIYGITDLLVAEQVVFHICLIDLRCVLFLTEDVDGLVVSDLEKVRRKLARLIVLA